jgi:hypothetical protein
MVASRQRWRHGGQQLHNCNGFTTATASQWRQLREDGSFPMTAASRQLHLLITLASQRRLLDSGFTMAASQWWQRHGGQRLCNSNSFMTAAASQRRRLYEDDDSQQQRLHAGFTF